MQNTSNIFQNIADIAIKLKITLFAYNIK